MTALKATGHLELLAPRHGIGEIPQLSAVSAWQWAGSLTLIEQWRPRLMGPHAQWFLGHAWTLGYEEQFYIVMGLLAWAISRRWLAGTAWITAVTVAAMAVFPGGELAGTFLNGYWLPFACGVSVYAVRIGHRWPVLPLLALALGVWWAPTVDSRFALSLSVGAAFALVLMALQPHDVRVSGTRWLAPLHWCGVRCYTIYLIHWPIVKVTEGALSGLLGDGMLVTFALAVPASVGLTLLAAAPFHAYIERPCMGLNPGPAAVRPPAAAMIRA